MLKYRYFMQHSRNPMIPSQTHSAKKEMGIMNTLALTPSLQCEKTGGEKNTFRKKLFLQGDTITYFVYFTVMVFLVMMTASCGYSSKSLIRSNVRSIYIPIFDNNTFRRGYEFDLTKAVRDQILMRTRLHLVDKDEADSILFGKIASFDENVLIVNSHDNIVESRTSVRIEIRWVDKRTGRVIVERKNIAKPAEFITLRNETLTSSKNEALVNVARSIVDTMEEDW
ncbi:hypothetical protein BIY37_06650 [Candidatus Brocadia sapporoensis]|uniref:Lipopolysaccharide-assembly n=2 Tax=Candidatus Brocadia sapporoensis TaxID=392547 RepID=A0A1V6M0C5_9BACT|nr:hypothetical protein [Candidatus Brocadia sp.]OQD45796.1 hypothetical protein BIY37_06650 [Candidatus Brocadia sapporoensis]